jgi:hypothetical protein
MFILLLHSPGRGLAVGGIRIMSLGGAPESAPQTLYHLSATTLLQPGKCSRDLARCPMAYCPFQLLLAHRVAGDNFQNGLFNGAAAAQVKLAMSRLHHFGHIAKQQQGAPKRFTTSRYNSSVPASSEGSTAPACSSAWRAWGRTNNEPLLITATGRSESFCIPEIISLRLLCSVGSPAPTIVIQSIVPGLWAARVSCNWAKISYVGQYSRISAVFPGFFPY